MPSPEASSLYATRCMESGPCAGRRNDYGRDHQHVHHPWRLIAGADPTTYAFLDANDARDKTASYTFAKRLRTRVDHFGILSGGYASDGRQHFYQDIVIQGPGFELLGGPANSDRADARTAA